MIYLVCVAQALLVHVISIIDGLSDNIVSSILQQPQYHSTNFQEEAEDFVCSASASRPN